MIFDWIINNWYNVLFCVLVILCSVYGVMSGKCKEWLKFAVSVAEKELGTGTGQLKLRQVYDMFISQFPWFSKIVPFNIFSKWVDLALEWLHEQLDKNANIKELITYAD